MGRAIGKVVNEVQYEAEATISGQAAYDSTRGIDEATVLGAVKDAVDRRVPTKRKRSTKSPRLPLEEESPETDSSEGKEEW